MNKTILIILAVMIVAAGLVYWMLQGSTSNTAPNTNQTTTSNMDLKVEDLTVGNGEEAKNGELVTVNYVGTLDDGTTFDSSYDRNQPFQFVLGAGQVIPGWDQGVLGMKVGGKRRLTIPSSLAYGEAGITDPRTGKVIIPQNATLHFDVELLGVTQSGSAK